MRHIIIYILGTMMVMATLGCESRQEHTAPAIYPKDSVSVMTSYGVNTLISDSGVIKYRIVTERWDVNQAKRVSRWTFDKGLFLEQFDQKLHINSYIQADTAYYFDQLHLWELRGRVRVLTKDGLRFTSEELFWDENKHELWSDMYSKLVTPERTLEGTYFRSDEKMTKYYVSNSKGSFERSDIEDSSSDSIRTAPDSVKGTLRQQTLPRRATSIPLTH